MILIQKALGVCSNPNTPLLKMAEEIDTLHTRIVNMGVINFDDLHAIFLLNCLSDSHNTIRSHLLNITKESSFSSKTVICRFAQEDSHSRHRNEVAQMTSVFAAQSQGKSHSLCTNCKRPGHLADFCVQLGEGMARRSIDDAHTAQHAAAGKPPQNESSFTKASGTSHASAKIASSDAKPSPDSQPSTTPDFIVIGGVKILPGHHTSEFCCLCCPLADFLHRDSKRLLG